MLQQSGLIEKIRNDVRWDMIRSSKGGYLAVTPVKSLRMASNEEKGLTLADTEGMFLFLGIGFLVASGVLVSEWVGGCTNKCIRLVRVKRLKKHEEERIEDERREAEYLAKTALKSASRAIGLSFSSTKETLLNIQTESPSHKSSRSSSVSVHELSPAMLTEMYNGPTNTNSNIVMIDGKMMSETDALKYANGFKHDEEVIDTNFEFLNSEKSSNSSIYQNIDESKEVLNSIASKYSEYDEKPNTAPSDGHHHARKPSTCGSLDRFESVDCQNSKNNSGPTPASKHDEKLHFNETVGLISDENKKVTQVEINLQAPTPTDVEDFFGEKVEAPKVKRRYKKL